MRQLRRQQGGFTIIELMIATSILAIILLLVGAVSANVGRLYHKGVSQTKIQTATRNLADDVSKNLELSAGYTAGGAAAVDRGSGGGAQAYCIGETRYTYILGRQLGTGTEPVRGGGTIAKVPHVLWRDRIISGSACTPVGMVTPGANGTELMPDGSRLLYFTIDDTAGRNTYAIKAGMAYGDADLLTATTGTAARCRNTASNEFCAKASTSTVAVKRLN